MASPEDDIERAVDEILDPAWTRERRLAFKRMTFFAAGRILVFLLGLLLFALAVHEVFGLAVPWPFLVFVTIVLIVFGLPDVVGDQSHLRRD